MTMQMIVGTSETTAIANVGSSFSPALVADWLDYNKDKSPATIKTYNAALKNFFNWLADNQIVLPKRNDVVEYVNKQAVRESEECGKVAIMPVNEIEDVVWL